MFEPLHLNPANIYLMFSKYPNVKVYPPGTILLLYKIRYIYCLHGRGREACTQYSLQAKMNVLLYLR